MPEIIRIPCAIRIDVTTKIENPKILFTGPFWSDIADEPLYNYTVTCLEQKILEQEDDTEEIPLELICFGVPMEGSNQALKAMLNVGNVPATVKHHLYFGRQHENLEATSSIVSLGTPLNRITGEMLENDENLQRRFQLLGERAWQAEAGGIVPWWTKNSFNDERKLTVCLYESKWKPQTFFLTVPLPKK